MEILKGHYVRSPYCGADGERRLLLAIITRAVEQAAAGNAEARAWLADTGSDWCEALLGIEVPPTAWAQLDLAEAKRRLHSDPTNIAARQERERAAWRERGARYRQRKREQRNA